MVAASTAGALAALARAARDRRRARLAYRDAGGALSHREIEVLALAFRGGRWLVAAHCHLRGAFRLLAVDRVLEIRVGRRRAHEPPPPAFDAAEFGRGDLLDPEAGPARRAALRLPPALRPHAALLVPGALREVPGGGAWEAGDEGPGAGVVHLRATSRGALRAFAASLGEGAAPLRFG